MRTRTTALRTLLLFTTLAVSAVIPCRADSHAKDDRAKFDVRIPFEFVVGNRVMAPGTYRVEQLLGSSSELDILSIRCLEFRAYHAVTTAVVTSPDPQAFSRLVFRRYGNRSFLAGLWMRGKTIGLRLQPSVTEKEVAKAQLAVEEVSLNVGTEATVASVSTVSGH